MLEKLTKSLTKKVTHQIASTAKETVSESVEKTVKSKLPLILTTAVIAGTVLSLLEPRSKKPVCSTVTIINNYYFAK